MNTVRFSQFVLLVLVFSIVAYTGDVEGMDRTNVEFDLTETEEDFLLSEDELSVNNSNVSVDFSDKFATFRFSVREYGGSDVYITIILSERVIKPSIIGAVRSKGGRVATWNVTGNLTEISFSLGAYSMDEFEISKLDILAGRIERQYRGGKKNIVYGERSYIFDCLLNDSTSHFSIFLAKNLGEYDLEGELEADEVMVKYRAKHGFLYPLRNKYKDENWFEVRDINATTYQVVVHFAEGSGDVVVVLQPGILDYISAGPLLKLIKWDEPVASLER